MKNLHIFVQLIFALVAVFYKRKKKVIHLRMVFWFGFQFEKKHFALTQIKTNKTGKISLPTYTYLPRTIGRALPVTILLTKVSDLTFGKMTFRIKHVTQVTIIV